MKTFFIIIALLGGICGSIGYANIDFGAPTSMSVPGTPNVTYEIKQIYMPRLNCKRDMDNVTENDLEEYARLCFDVRPEHIKMTMPSI
tara:strand:- start:265 stop:528 length:264 start_codon:yes stop_codon:yes gene_type:complete